MKKIILAILFLCSISITKGDSPLTSTDFYKVYTDIEIVQKAVEAKGKLTNELMLYISDRSNPVDIKMAIINAVGWQVSGNDNFNKYLDFVEFRYSTNSNEDRFYKKVDGDELLALAYLKALGDYFDVKEAAMIADRALYNSIRTESSYTFNIIHGLIKAQLAFDTSWCDSYKAVNNVRKNTNLKEDFPAVANYIVFDYMDLYRDGNCD